MYKDNDLNFINKTFGRKLNEVQRSRRRFDRKINRFLNKEMGIFDIGWSIMTLIVKRFIIDLLLSYLICITLNLSFTFMWIFVVSRVFMVSNNIFRVVLNNLE
jgi:hypothetical protein